MQSRAVQLTLAKRLDGSSFFYLGKDSFSSCLSNTVAPNADFVKIKPQLNYKARICLLNISGGMRLVYLNLMTTIKINCKQKLQKL